MKPAFALEIDAMLAQIDAAEALLRSSPQDTPGTCSFGLPFLQHARTTLERLQERHMQLSGSSRALVLEMDSSLRVHYVNDAVVATLGYAAEELVGKTWPALFPDAAARLETAMQGLCRRQTIDPYLTSYETRKGEARFIEWSIGGLYGPEGAIDRVVALGTDRSARVRAEHRIRGLSRVYATLSETNQLIVRTRDETTLLQEFCRIAVELGGFCLAWIGLIDPVTERVEQRAFFGAEIVDASAISQAIGNVYRGRGPAATALRFGRTVYTNDVRREPDDSPWHVDPVPGRFIGAAALPLRRSGALVGAVKLYLSEANFFDDEQLRLLEEMASDLSFALDNIDREKARRDAEEALRRSELVQRDLATTLKAMIDALPAAIVLLAEDGTIVDCNETWRRFGGENGLNDANHCVGQSYLDPCDAATGADAENAESAAAAIRAVLGGTRQVAELEYACHTPTKQRWFRMMAAPLDLSQQRGAVVMHVDITERMEAEMESFRLAHFDSLTGLCNRALFNVRLREAIDQSARHDWRTAVLFIDLDRFKGVNDTLGHATGDLLLQKVASRMASRMRTSDTVGRLGGDEFAVIVSDIGDPSHAGQIARNLLECLDTSFNLSGFETYVTASIGITVYPDDSRDGETLLKNADIAMYRAKEQGANNYQFFTSSMTKRAIDRLRLETDLRKALQRGEFLLHYQPIIELSSGLVSGFEALMRWQHPERGLVPPAHFIPALEDMRLIGDAGEWVLRTACAQTKRWHEHGAEGLTIAVNVSTLQLSRGGLADTVAGILRQTGLHGAFLELELTESAVMQESEANLMELSRLRELGVRIVLDDFGTGYSSLGYLQRLPVSAVKIDQTFVRGVASDANSASIVRAVINLARSLDLVTVAEGVESEAQLNFVTANHCKYAQGYLLSRPLTTAACTELLRTKPRFDLPGSTREAGTRTLLLIDDEPRILLSLKRVLQRDGYRILTAGSTDEGMALLGTHRVGVIVADQRMPGTTGIEFLSKVRLIYPDIVRIVLSGYADFQSVTDAINRGAIYKFLTKPWDDEQLRTNIAEAFRLFELAVENERLHRELRTVNTELQSLLPLPRASSIAPANERADDRRVGRRASDQNVPPAAADDHCTRA